MVQYVAFWVFQSMLLIVNLIIHNFRIINRQPNFCAKCFSKINPDAHVCAKINTFTFYKAPPPPEAKEMLKLEMCPWNTDAPAIAKFA